MNRVDAPLVASLTDVAGLPAASEDVELINRAKRDPHALAALYRAHHEAIGRYVLRRVGKPADAEDITAEVFLTMVRCLPRYRAGGAPFRAWLYRLAADQIHRWVSKQKRRGWRQLLETPCPRSTNATTVHDAADAVRQALWRLPRANQDAVALFHLQELPIEEIAQVLGCPVGTVKSRLARGRDMLRAELTRSEIET